MSKQDEKQSLYQYVDEQLAKQNTDNKSIGGRLFDSYGSNLTDFPEDIVNHVKYFTGENLEEWVETLYRLMSEWLQQALWVENLPAYLTKNPIKDFIGGFYLAISQYVIQNASGFAKVIAVQSLSAIIGRINLEYYGKPLPEGAPLSSALASPFANPFIKQEISAIIQKALTGPGFILTLAKDLTENNVVSVQELKDIIQHLSPQCRDELIESVFADFLNLDLNNHFQNETSWDILANIINLLVICNKLDDERFEHVAQWLNADPERMQKLANKIITHKNFPGLRNLYIQCEHLIANSVTLQLKKESNYISTVKALSERISPIIAKATTLTDIDRAVNVVTQVVRGQESSLGKPIPANDQLLEELKEKAGIRKAQPDLAYIPFYSASEVLNHANSDMNIASTPHRIQNIADNAKKRMVQIPAYDLCLMLRKDIVILPGKLYLQEIKGKIVYIVINSEDKIVKIVTDIPAKSPLNLEQLASLKESILKVALEKGHVPSIQSYHAAIDAHAYIAVLKQKLETVTDEGQMRVLKKEAFIYLKSLNSLSPKLFNHYMVTADRLTTPLKILLHKAVNHGSHLQQAILDKLLIMYRHTSRLEIKKWVYEKRSLPGADALMDSMADHCKKEILALKLDNDTLTGLIKLAGSYDSSTHMGEEGHTITSLIIAWHTILTEIHNLAAEKNLVADVITQFQTAVKSPKDKDEVNELALTAKATLLSLEGDEEKQQELFKMIDGIVKDKTTEPTLGLAKGPNSKDEARNLLKIYLEKYPHIRTVVKYIAYSAAGLLAAKVLLPATIVAAIGKLGIMGVRALFTTPVGHATAAAAVSVGAAMSAGLFKRKTPIESDPGTYQKISKIVKNATHQAMMKCDSQSAVADRAELAKHEDAPAALLANVIRLIEDDHNLGHLLIDELKTEFGMEKLSADELLDQLKQLLPELEKNSVKEQVSTPSAST